MGQVHVHTLAVAAVLAALRCAVCLATMQPPKYFDGLSLPPSHMYMLGDASREEMPAKPYLSPPPPSAHMQPGAGPVAIPPGHDAPSLGWRQPENEWRLAPPRVDEGVFDDAAPDFNKMSSGRWTNPAKSREQLEELSGAPFYGRRSFAVAPALAVEHNRSASAARSSPFLPGGSSLRAPQRSALTVKSAAEPLNGARRYSLAQQRPSPSRFRAAEYPAAPRPEDAPAPEPSAGRLPDARSTIAAGLAQVLHNPLTYSALKKSQFRSLSDALGSLSSILPGQAKQWQSRKTINRVSAEDEMSSYKKPHSDGGPLSVNWNPHTAMEYPAQDGPQSASLALDPNSRAPRSLKLPRLHYRDDREVDLGFRSPPVSPRTQFRRSSAVTGLSLHSRNPQSRFRSTDSSRESPSNDWRGSGQDRPVRRLMQTRDHLPANPVFPSLPQDQLPSRASSQKGMPSRGKLVPKSSAGSRDSIRNLDIAESQWAAPGKTIKRRSSSFRNSLTTRKAPRKTSFRVADSPALKKRTQIEQRRSFHPKSFRKPTEGRSESFGRASKSPRGGRGNSPFHRYSLRSRQFQIRMGGDEDNEDDDGPPEHDEDAPTSSEESEVDEVAPTGPPKKASKSEKAEDLPAPLLIDHPAIKYKLKVVFVDGSHQVPPPGSGASPLEEGEEPQPPEEPFPMDEEDDEEENDEADDKKPEARFGMMSYPYPMAGGYGPSYTMPLNLLRAPGVGGVPPAGQPPAPPPGQPPGPPPGPPPGDDKEDYDAPHDKKAKGRLGVLGVPARYRIRIRPSYVVRPSTAIVRPSVLVRGGAPSGRQTPMSRTQQPSSEDPDSSEIHDETEYDDPEHGLDSEETKSSESERPSLPPSAPPSAPHMPDLEGFDPYHHPSSHPNDHNPNSHLNDHNPNSVVRQLFMLCFLQNPFSAEKCASPVAHENDVDHFQR